MNTLNSEKLTATVLTLGCKVSQYESRAIEQGLLESGFTVVHDARHADCIVVNTCTVTAESDRKCRQLLHRLRRENPNSFLAATGCYTQVATNEVQALGICDYLCGSRNKLSVVQAAELFFRREKNTPQVAVCAPDALPFEPMCVNGSERTRAYVKIEDGCENHCSYCAIPLARGGVVSKPKEQVLAEVRGLAARGYREVVLTGIEAGSWGKDLGAERLVDLCEAVNEIPGIARIRLGSLDPSYMRSAVIERMAKLSHLAPHFHLSVQSGCDTVLHRMRRRYRAEDVLRTLSLMREKIPNVQFTTDLLVGFPGETEEEFAKTLKFIDCAGFLYIHIFPYSRRRGTEADCLPGQLTKLQKARRVHIASQHMQAARMALLCDRLGKTDTVLFETFENGFAQGHTASFLEVRVKSDTDLHNTFAEVLLREVLPDGALLAELCGTERMKGSNV